MSNLRNISHDTENRRKHVIKIIPKITSYKIEIKSQRFTVFRKKPFPLPCIKIIRLKFDFSIFTKIDLSIPTIYFLTHETKS